MTTATAPAVVRAASLPDSIKVEQLTCAIGAELSNVNLGVASRDPALVAEIRKLLLQHRVLFFRDQDITRAGSASKPAVNSVRRSLRGWPSRLHRKVGSGAAT